MSTASAPVRYEYHVALGYPGEARLLLLAAPDGWRLPGFSTSERRFWRDVDHVNSWLGASLGAPAAALRCITISYSPNDELVSLIYAAALHDRGWAAPTAARWVAPDQLPAIPLAHEAHRAALAEWFAWYAGGPAPHGRVPWYMPGWHAETIPWAVAALQRAGLPPTGPAEQLRSWQRSAILRLPTREGHAYFKAVPPMFGHEPALTAALAAADPARFARPVAIDAERGWLLMRELPGRTLERLRDDADVALWQRALADFAEVQLSTIERHAELRALGVPERPLGTLATRLTPLLDDPAATLPGRPAGLSDEERARLRALAPRLAATAEELAAYGLPAALEHGDFWAGQVVAGEGGFGFLDWSDSSIAHPFFSLLLFLVESEDFFPRVPAVRERLRDAYLEPWSGHARGADLARAFELAQPLAALHHALAYHSVVLPKIEVRWEMELMLPFYLKMALRLTP